MSSDELECFSPSPTAQDHGESHYPEKQCPICREKAFKNHLNYGAISCYSCRAFFRRTHNDSEAPPKFKCKSGKNSCDIVGKVQRRCCKACRYRACLQAGMSPKAVLKEGQRKKRFAKSFFKEKGDQSPPPPLPCSTLSSSSSSSAHPSSTALLVKPEDVVPWIQAMPKNNRSAFFRPCQSLHIHDEHDTDQVQEDVNCRREMVQKVMTAWTRAWRDYSLDSSFVADVVRAQMEETVLSSNLLDEHVKGLAGKFHDFALELDGFWELSSETQKQMVENNASLFVLFLLSKAVASKTGLEQLGWLLLEPLLFQPGHRVQKKLKPLSLEQINIVANVASGELVIKKVASLSCGFECLPLLSAFMLFRSNERCLFGNTSNSEATVIGNNFARLFNCLRPNCCPGCVSLQRYPELMAALESLQSFCQSNNSTSSGKDLSLGYRLMSHYTTNEESWYESHQRLLSETYYSIPLGEDVCEELVKCSLGVPISPTMSMKLSQILTERAQRMFLMHQEIMNMSHQQYQRVWPHSALESVTITWAKAETCSSLQEQFAYFVGPVDRDFLDQPRFARLLVTSGKRIPPLKFMDWSSPEKVPFNPEQRKDLQRLWGEIAEEMGNKETFQLFNLISMFSADVNDKDIEPALKFNLQKYISLLGRKRRSSPGVDGGDKSSFEDLKNSISCVKQLNFYSKLMLASIGIQ